jgi:competence protein ComEA
MPEIVVTTGWREKLEALAGRRRESWIVAAVAAAAVLASLLMWARGAPDKVAPPATAPDPAVAIMPSATPSPSAPVVLVHVAGAVRKPGVYEFPAGARVADAIEGAHPFRAADLGVLNLAEPLTDAMKIDVPRRGEQAAAPPPPSASSPSPGAIGLVNVNTADQAALETIPGIGPVTATAIIDWRTQSGPFTSIDQLLEVSGIGPATLESIRPYVTI